MLFFFFYYYSHLTTHLMYLAVYLFWLFDLIVFGFIQCGDKGAFQVVVDNYVKEEEGTGVVHQAPYFGAVSELSWTFSYVVFILLIKWLWGQFCLQKKIMAPLDKSI